MGIKKTTFSICLFLLILCSCTTTRVISKSETLPTKSFVKIINTTEIISCTNTKDKKCPIGKLAYTGSGMAVNLIPGEMTVLTAGHVCDSRPTDAVKEFSQTLHVIDYNSKLHQAWAVLISHNDQQGSGDLCLLWVPTLEVKKINYSLIGPKVGDELVYLGAPMGIYHPPTVPIFKGIYSGIVDASSALITAPATGGSSGGAVLNKKNQIVGIIWGSNPQFKHVSVMTNHKSFLLFLKKAVVAAKLKYQ